MKYITEIYQNCNDGSLDSEEVTIVKKFLNTIKSIENVSGILLRGLSKTHYVGLDQLNYSNITITILTPGKPETIPEIKDIKKSINDFRYDLNSRTYQFEDNEFNVNIYDLDYYLNDSTAKTWTETDIVSSYILLDRTGLISDTQDTLKETTKPYEKLTNITNIDKLEKNYKRVR